MENNKNKKSVKFQGDMLNFYDFIQVFVFTTNHHLKHCLIVMHYKIVPFQARHSVPRNFLLYLSVIKSTALLNLRNYSTCFIP